MQAELLGSRQGRLEGITWMRLQIQRKNVPGPELSLLAGLVVQVDAIAGETPAHCRGSWEEDEQQVANSCQAAAAGQHRDCLPPTCKAGQLEETGLRQICTQQQIVAAAAVR